MTVLKAEKAGFMTFTQDTINTMIWIVQGPVPIQTAILLPSLRATCFQGHSSHPTCRASWPRVPEGSHTVAVAVPAPGPCISSPGGPTRPGYPSGTAEVESEV